MKCAFRAACLLLLLTVPAMAQEPLSPARLPADTTFYFHWRGTSAFGAARATNSLLRLWADPEFAPAQEAMRKAFLEGAAKGNKEAQNLTAEDWETIFSLMENPLLVGYAGKLAIGGTAGNPGGENKAVAARGAFFAIYDTNGKTAAFNRMRARMAEGARTKPVITTYAFGPTTVQKSVSPENTSFTAQVGQYVISADQQDAVEDLILRFRSPKDAKPTLGGTPDFRLAQEKIGPGAVLEFFGRIPDLSAIPMGSNPNFDVGAFTRALHLEKVRMVCGSLSLAGTATRLRTAVLGDTSAGSILALLGDNSPEFESLALAPAGALSFSVTKINFAGLYQTVRAAAEAAISEKQRTNLTLMEAFAANQIEMSIPDALALFSGEIATIANWPPDAGPSQLFAIGIQKPQNVLRLLHTILPKQIASEERVGETTFLKFASPAGKSADVTQPAPSYYAAVTPRWLLADSQGDLLRKAVQHASAKSAPAPPLAADAAFVRARSKFPASLSGFGYYDLTRVPWEKLIEEFEKSKQKTTQAAYRPSSQKTDRPVAISPAVLRRYLHAFASASWKDREGLFFDGYIE